MAENWVSYSASRNGPDLDDIYHILCLEDDEGRSAGLMRFMDDADVELGSQIELIVISCPLGPLVIKTSQRPLRNA